MNGLLWQNVVLLFGSGGSLYWLITRINPLAATDVTLPLVLFLLCFFVLSWSFLTFVGFFFTEAIKAKSLGKHIYRQAARRSFLISLLLVCLLTMQFFRVFGWMEAGFLLLFMIIIEVLMTSPNQ
jgi:hypothetical protein